MLNFSILFLSKFIVILLTLLGIKIFTTTLDVNEFANYILLMSISLIIHQLIFAPIVVSASRYVKEAVNQKELSKYFNNLILVINKNTFKLIIPLVLITLIVLFFNSKNVLLVIIFILYNYFYGLNSIYISIFNYINNRIYFGLFQVAEIFFKILLSSALLIFYDNILLNLFIGFFLGSLIIHIILITIYNQKFKIRIMFNNINIFRSHKYYFNKLISFSSVYFYLGIVSSLYLASDRWLIYYFLTIEEVAYYGAMWQLFFAPFVILSGVLQSYFEPNLYSLYNKNIHKIFFVRVFIIFLILLSFFTIFYFLIRNSVSEYLLPIEYNSYSYISLFLIIIGFVFCLLNYLKIYFKAKELLRYLFKIEISAIILGITLNSFLINYYGIMGLLYGILIYQIFLLVNILIKTLSDSN